MRTSILSSVAIVCLSSASTVAQEPETISRTIFKLSPQHFTINALKAGVERFNSKHSGSIAFFVTGMLESNGNAIERDGFNGLAGELQLRKYVSPMRARTTKKNNVYYQGIYGGAYLQAGSYSGTFTDEYSYFDPNTGTVITQWRTNHKENVGNWGLGFTIGYQKTLWQVIFVEAFIGGGVQFADRQVTGQTTDPAYYYTRTGIVNPAYRGILPKIGLQIGIGL